LLEGNFNFVDVNDLSTDDHDITILFNVKDLGVIIDTKFNFSANIDSAVAKAVQRI